MPRWPMPGPRTFPLSILSLGHWTVVFLVAAVGLLGTAPWAPQGLWTGLPLGLWVLGPLVVPGAVVRRTLGWGPLRGALAGLALGAAGAVLIVVGLTTGHFALICGGFLVHGAHRAFVPTSPAVSVALGGVLGPLIGLGTRDLTPVPFVGGFVVVLGLIAAQALFLVAFPQASGRGGAPARPPRIPGGAGGGRSLGVGLVALGAAVLPVAVHESGLGLGVSVAATLTLGVSLGLTLVVVRRWVRGQPTGWGLAVLGLALASPILGADEGGFLVSGLLGGVSAGLLLGKQPLGGGALVAGAACVFLGVVAERWWGWQGLPWAEAPVWIVAIGLFVKANSIKK